VRGLLISAALTASLVLSGCNGDSLSPSAKASKPIPEKLLKEIEAKNMDKGSPMLVRLFKQEAELEVWKQDRSGRFALLKTYPICRWSGDLGPKIREGDRQAPEGFYSITPGQMNPASSYYLSFNMGYPNAYDKAWGRTGSQLMVHGDCSSRGCYAMTDEQISEIYSLGRESFFGGQTAFQVQAYPFRMTAQNMAKYRSNPNMPFWRMLKEGNDHFEVSKLEPKIDVCEKRYVFDAEQPANASRPLTFNAAGKCPVYEINPEIAQAVAEKEQRDTAKVAELVSHGVSAPKSRAGIDGGMHPVFANKLPDAQSIAIADVNDYAVSANGAAPGTIPSHVNPPRLPEGQVSAFTFASTPAAGAADTPPPPPAAKTETADTGSSASGGFFSRLAQKVGLRKDAEPTAEPAKPTTTARVIGHKRKPEPKSSSAAKSTSVARTAEPKAPAARVISLEKQQAEARSTFPDPVISRPTPPQTISGARSTVQANSFDQRWSSFR
jgi:murein L,D-transpeptidase YafK